MAYQQEIFHGLELPLAKKAIDKAMEEYSARFADYSPTFGWTTETRGEFGFTAKGLEVTGNLDIQGDKVLVELEVPWIFRVFRKKALDVIETNVKAWIERAKNGELD